MPSVAENPNPESLTIYSIAEKFPAPPVTEERLQEVAQAIRAVNLSRDMQISLSFLFRFLRTQNQTYEEIAKAFSGAKTITPARVMREVDHARETYQDEWEKLQARLSFTHTERTRMLTTEVWELRIRFPDMTKEELIRKTGTGTLLLDLCLGRGFKAGLPRQYREPYTLKDVNRNTTLEMLLKFTEDHPNERFNLREAAQVLGIRYSELRIIYDKAAGETSSLPPLYGERIRRKQEP